jgi:hypothetical protein
MNQKHSMVLLHKNMSINSVNIDLTPKQIDELLNPYCSREIIVSKWKEILIDLKKLPSLKNMEWLAQALRSKYNISSRAISSLFNRSYIETKPEIDKCPDLKIFFHPIGFEGLDQFDYSDEEFVSELKKRLEYPKIGESRFDLGPTNSDLNSSLEKVLWCHLDKTESDDEEALGFHHGMIKCQCYHEIPEKGFVCSGCKDFFPWNSIGFEGEGWSEDFVRFPIIDQDLGGWGEFYCSRQCMIQFSSSKMTNMHDIIVEMIESTIEIQDE